MSILDQYINYDERMVGANHPTLDDTLNRALRWHVDDLNTSHTLTNILRTNNTANVDLKMGSGFDIILGSSSEITLGATSKITGGTDSFDFGSGEIDNLTTDFIVGQEAYFIRLDIGGGLGNLYEGYYDGYYGDDIYDQPGGLSIDENGNLRTDGTIKGTHLQCVKTLTSNYTATIRDAVMLVDTSGGDVNLFLPGILTEGLTYNIKKIDSSGNSVIIDGIGNTIDGAATTTITTQYDSLTLVSDGSNWFII